MDIVKKYGIWLSLALTLLASYWTATQASDDAEALLAAPSQRHIQIADSSPAVQAATTTVLMQRPQMQEASVNLFSPLAPPSALATNESLVDVPQTPENPYRYAGKVVEDGQVSVFLTDGTNNYVVKAGDVIDGVWQVQAIRPPQLILKYLPLKTEVNIEIGALS